MMPKNTDKETTIFVLQVIGAFFLTFIVLLVFGFLPKELRPDISSSDSFAESDAEAQYAYDNEYTYVAPQDTDTEYVRAIPDRYQQEAAPQTATKPTYISIPKIDVSSQILQPNSQRVDVLDAALQQGAVYYPGSGTIEGGNIFLFGHSTNWAIVQNQAYKTFNDLDKLVVGDEIQLKANGKTYIYSVEKVQLVDANQAFIDLSKPGRRLTISTCNTFGEKSERWVVDAVFKEVL